MTLKVLFAGSGEFGLPTLQVLAEQHRVVQVFTQPDRPAGRGRKLAPTPVAEFAGRAGLPLLKTDDFNSCPLPEAQVLVVIAFGQKISQTQAGKPPLGAINLHASRLPRWRGAGPIPAAILAGDAVTGNSVIRLAERMDAGDILAQSEIPIAETDTAALLHDRLAEDGAQLIMRVVAELLEGRERPKRQDESQATRAPKISRADAVIDWSRPAREVSRRINAFSPWPGCRVRLLDVHGAQVDTLTLLRCCPAESTTDAEPGQIDQSGLIACDGGAVEIMELQPAGRKAMYLAAYRNGRPWGQGMRLEPIRAG